MWKHSHEGSWWCTHLLTPTAPRVAVSQAPLDWNPTALRRRRFQCHRTPGQPAHHMPDQVLLMLQTMVIVLITTLSSKNNLFQLHQWQSILLFNRQHANMQILGSMCTNRNKPNEHTCQKHKFWQIHVRSFAEIVICVMSHNEMNHPYFDRSVAKKT